MRMRNFGVVVPLVWFQATACTAQHGDQDGSLGGYSAPAVAPPLAQVLGGMGLSPGEVHFKVDKSERRFEVVVHGIVVKAYACVLGEVPDGDKMIQGDRRTPEGVFGIRSKRLHDKWHAFVWVDYPNAESRRRFEQRKREGVIPADATIGGEIGIHGVPKGMDHWVDAGVDWTFGCIALKNADMDEIHPYIKQGTTTISIVP